MKAQRHVQLLAHGPERIVIRLVDVRHVLQFHRRRRIDNPFVTKLHRAADFRHRSVHRPQGHDALRDKARALVDPFLDQPIIVGLHGGGFELDIIETAKPLSRHAARARIEHGIVNPVFIHGPQTFVWALRRQSRLRETGTGWLDRSIIDHPALTAVCLRFDVRHTTAPFLLGHSLRPNLGMLADVVVSADYSVLEFHGCCR